VESFLRWRQLISLAGSSRFEFSHSSKYEGNCLVGYDAVYFGMKVSVSWRNLLSPFSLFYAKDGCSRLVWNDTFVLDDTEDCNVHKVLCLLWSYNIHYHVHKGPSLVLP
jgi:hypothetical protein